MEPKEPKVDILSDVLNTEYVEEEKFEVIEAQAEKSLAVISDDNSTDEDFEYARENLKDMIEKGNMAIDGILNLAKESESPRTYEVAAQLIKTMAEANKDLLGLRKQKKELQKDDTPKQNNTTNNNLFVGSTADLAKMLKAKREENE
jgi:hypothetical protein